MKQVTFALVILIIVTITSCNKDNPGSGQAGAGTWTFKGNTDTATSCVATPPSLMASNATPNNGNSTSFTTLTCTFSGNTLPTTNGTYIVSNIANAANQVSIQFTTGGSNINLYTATGGNGINQTVAVTVSNGKLHISGSGIEMLNSSVATDSSVLQFNITQQ